MKTRLSNQSDFRHCLATSLCISDRSALRSIQRLWNQSTSPSQKFISKSIRPRLSKKGNVVVVVIVVVVVVAIFAISGTMS